MWKQIITPSSDCFNALSLKYSPHSICAYLHKNNVRLWCITHGHTEGFIVFVTCPLVCCSLSRLIPDFCFCSSSHCMLWSIILSTKVTFSSREEVTSFLTAGRCQGETCPTYTGLKYVIKSADLEQSAFIQKQINMFWQDKIYEKWVLKNEMIL